jgi:hypothetical protein
MQHELDDRVYFLIHCRDHLPQGQLAKGTTLLEFRAGCTAAGSTKAAVVPPVQTRAFCRSLRKARNNVANLCEQVEETLPETNDDGSAAKGWPHD